MRFSGLFAWLAEKRIDRDVQQAALPKVPGIPVEIVWFLVIALLATWVLLRTPVGNWVFAAGWRFQRGHQFRCSGAQG